MIAYAKLRLDALGPLAGPSPPKDFHVLRTARDAYGWEGSLFGLRGDVVFASLEGAHRFADAWNRARAATPAEALQPSQVNAMGLIHEVFHAVIGRYRAAVPGAFDALIAELRDALGDDLDATLRAFVVAFPPPAVYRGDITIDAYLAGSQEGITNVEWTLEEMLLSWLGNENPAYAPIATIISDEELRKTTRYEAVLGVARGFFDGQPRFGPTAETLLEMLLEPIKRAPHSLIGQLEYMRDRWGLEIDLLHRVLLASDFVKEEGKWFLRGGHGHDDGASAPLSPASFAGELYVHEPEQFSADRDWMPRVVMIAKSALVWLDQLAKQYARKVATLADVPDEELDRLARRGFTGLWLIGIWRRSEASARIKRKMGNPDAAASAYSLYDYEIAPELGGEGAYASLKSRAARRGIRLASDMVPNHMGIDSRWVKEHPEWFLQTREPPFPSYTFNGEDLGDDPRVGIFLEDGYWNQSDAAIVFKRVDKWTGDTRYILHGNDGTRMPWNDTAQLNYLDAGVREAVIQTILHVARMFPIIRFDAAMTLAKRHFQRLWFPIPGTGGDIPSRASHAMTKERFDELFPVEFWREVVDRVAAEVPDTLLLAEAFWMMEGYFVRTLGMHRVYNSAFMNMLKKEENASYRLSVRNVLEFNPQILKRHVNFMNNPDEETAVAQFGKDDKYFGVCTLLSTMPGLPMFGHGQIEGFTEKYGMEYRRALYDERPDEGLVARHEREIFPLLAKRALFSDVESFLFYDFVTTGGQVDEDVFAYSNRREGERALVVYHNKWKDTRGHIKTSVGFLDAATGNIAQRPIGEGLALSRDKDVFTVFVDHVSGLEYLRENAELWDKGLWVELGAFKYHVFWKIRQVVHTEERPYRALAASLAGRGVASVDDGIVDLMLAPVHAPFWEAVSPGSAAYLLAAARPETVTEKLEHLAAGAAWLSGARDVAKKKVAPPAAIATKLLARYAALLALTPRAAVKTTAETATATTTKDATARAAVDGATAPMDAQRAIAWMFTSALLALRAASKDPRDWRAERVLARAFREAGATLEDARRDAALVNALAALPASAEPRQPLAARLALLLADAKVRDAVGVHTYDGVAYLRKEPFDALVAALGDAAHIDAGATDASAIAEEATALTKAAADAGYRFFDLEAALVEGKTARKAESESAQEGEEARSEREV